MGIDSSIFEIMTRHDVEDLSSFKLKRKTSNFCRFLAGLHLSNYTQNR
jgi:hypothetical protein